MRKRKKLEERISELEKKLELFEADVAYVQGAKFRCIAFEEDLDAVLRKTHNMVNKQDFDSEILRLDMWLQEVESKVSMKFYQNIGIYEKIRAEFSSQIAKNMKDIIKLKEKLVLYLDERSEDR